MTRKLFLGTAFALFLVAVGCGGANRTYTDSEKLPLPVSFSYPKYQPNYGKQLKGTSCFPKPVITYQIVTNQTTFNGQPVYGIEPTAVQYQDIRDAVAKWGKVLHGVRSFAEVYDNSADIAIVVQSAQEFEAVRFPSSTYEQGNGKIVYGSTNVWKTDIEKGLIGRSIVRLRDGIPERGFRRSAVHELAHALGLSGHSNDKGNILVGVQPFLLPEIELSEQDVNTMLANYER